MKIMNQAHRMFKKAAVKLRKRSPEIFIVAGVVGTVVGGVMACKATTKLSGILEESRDEIAIIKASASNERLKERYSEDDMKKDLAIVYVQTGIKIAKLYAPSVFVWGVSAAGIFASHGIMRGRNAALTEALAVMSTSYNEYRKRVAEHCGKETEHEIYCGVKPETSDGDNGEEKAAVTENGHRFGPYTRIFDESNPWWEKCADANSYFLKMEESHFNNTLKADGFVFLNDVFKQLGFEPTRIGQIVGWYYDPDDPTKHNYIDFGIYDLSDPAKRNFINGDERSVILDFNVDGNILDLI